MNVESEQLRSGQNCQDRTETGQTAGQTIQRKPVRRLAKTHVDYWVPKLKKRTYRDRDGREREVPTWQVRMFHRGRESWFNTNTANQAAAAAKAKEIYLSLVSGGWEATLAKHKPERVAALDCATVGDYLDSAKANSELRLTTFEVYARKFRTLVAGAFGVKTTKAKFDYVNGGRKKFLDRVNRIRLGRLTAERVERWKVRYLKRAEQAGPLAYKHARTTLNSVIRGSKALFAPAVVNRLPLKLTRPLPLEGVGNVSVERSRYRSLVNPQALLVAANTELAKATGKDATDKREQFKILLLALGAGLRRDEIDTLTWEQLDFQRNMIRVETTVHTAAKSNASEAEVDVDPGLLGILKEFMKPGAGEFVIRSPNKPRRQTSASYHYRCNRHFDGLITWLRGKGVATNNPLHTLRKEFGSQIAAQSGIFAASLALRHADIQLTRDYYLDKKQPSVFAVSKLLAPKQADQPVEGEKAA